MRPVVGYLIGDTAFIRQAVFAAAAGVGSGSAAHGACGRPVQMAAAHALPSATLSNPAVLPAQGCLGS